ncbi:MAG: LytTR family transcriptional regulator DNA-binding domain-containing protein [Bacillota bacterium]|nr:LytTR family transcriptional regulator DNA-binding domain-containing protein [Bacillota bacterium]
MAIRAMIIDDEAPARQELHFLLRKLGWVDVVGEADNAHDGFMMVLKLQPHVVFLDVQMPGKSGLELSKDLAQLKKTPYIVFTTAYDQYAIEAFNIDALDYLLKPYHEARVLKAAHKARGAIAEREDVPHRGGLERLPVRRGESTLLLPYEEIAVAFTDGRDVHVAARGEVFKTELTLQDLEARLYTRNFFRCHRSYLVNLDRIVEISPWFSGGYNLKLAGLAEPVMVSRKQSKVFRERIGI